MFAVKLFNLLLQLGQKLSQAFTDRTYCILITTGELQYTRYSYEPVSLNQKIEHRTKIKDDLEF